MFGFGSGNNEDVVFVGVEFFDEGGRCFWGERCIVGEVELSVGENQSGGAARPCNYCSISEFDAGLDSMGVVANEGSEIKVREGEVFSLYRGG